MNYRAQLDTSYVARELAAEHIARMLPKHRAELARDVLRELLIGDHVGYEHFQSAQAAERAIRKAVSALAEIN